MHEIKPCDTAIESQDTYEHLTKKPRHRHRRRSDCGSLGWRCRASAAHSTRDIWAVLSRNTPRYHGFDLTRIPRHPGRALGQVIELSGRVLNVDGSPVKGAALEIWQANAAGRYANPIDKNPAPLDPNFQGVALLHTTAQGRYRILTVKPGAYPDPSGGMRTPHIHFDVTSDDYRLVAQMYFPGEALNEKDILMSTMPARHRDPALTICKAVNS